MALDRTLEGRRVKLIYSDDPFTKLKRGDLGTIKYERLDDIWGEDTVSISWDSGSTLSMIRGRDSFELLPEEDG
tara:strand:+ start:276 stop:497 length:222 start_codon:yes stop_codon:yes gene_type:complete